VPDPGPSAALRFTTVLFRPDVTGAKTFIVLPDGARDALGGSRVPVRVVVAGHTFRSTTQVSRGDVRIAVNATVRAAAGVEAGQEVEVEVVRDDSLRDLDVPDELAGRLAGDPEAASVFGSLAPSHQREWCRWVAEAKRPETRRQRAERTVDRLRRGETRR